MFRPLAPAAAPGRAGGALALALAALCGCRSAAPTVRFDEKETARGAAPSPSRGCALRGPSPGPDGTVQRRLTSGGHARRFLLVRPPGDGAVPAPLVLNFHGITESPELQQLLSQMDPEARKRGMVLVYPEGLGLSWNAGGCCGRARDEQVDDVRFVRDLIAELESELCIDRNRVYATGMSNGGMFSYRLACDAADLFAAVAPVSAVDETLACAPRRPVPILSFNGKSDPVVHYGGGWFDLKSAQQSFAAWTARDRCAAGPARTVYKQGDAKCESAPGCAADVIACTLEGGGHTWPGGTRAPFLGRTSSDLDATTTLLDFFLAHPLQR
jgi:polyhydroxybutyrate depolymerase